MEPATAASVEVSPAEARVEIESMAALTATARDSRGEALRGVVVVWSTANPSVAAVASDGLVLARSAGETRVTATVDGVKGEARVEVVPPVPTSPSRLDVLVEEPGALRLQWNGGERYATRFEIERRRGASAFTLLDDVPAGSSAYADSGTEPDERYGYRVRSCNGMGCSGYSPEAEAITLPKSPSALKVVDVEPTAVVLAWTNESATETGFVVERRIAGGSYGEAARPGADAHDHRDAGLEPQTTYHYRVRACREDGCSEPSLEVQATTGAVPAPAAPSGLVSWLVTPSQIVLSWTDNSEDESSFRVDRALNGEAFAPLIELGENVTAHSDVSLSADTRYRYRVAACNAGGCSPFSAETFVATPPRAPTDLVATATGETEVTLSWTDASVTEREYRVERRQSGGTFAEVAELPAGAESFSDTALVRDTEYGYRVRACNESGCSGFSDEAAVTTPVTTPPEAPSQLVSVTGEQAQIGLIWSDNSLTETRFELERKRPDGSYAIIATVGADVETHTDMDVAFETRYVYRVRACGLPGCSPYSNEVTPITPPYAPDGLAATPSSQSVIELSWNDNSEAETEYRLERSSSVDGFVTSAIFRLLPGTTAFTDGGLVPGRTYRYRVRACMSVLCSAASQEVAATTLSGG